MDNQNRRTDDKRAPGQLQWGESGDTAAPAAERFGYTITPRAECVGGGWRLQLMESGQVVGGAVHPVAEDVTSDEAYQEALDDGEAWLLSRGAALRPNEPVGPAPAWVQYSRATDTLRIHGYKCSGELFRGLAFGLNIGEPFKIVNRANGTLWVERVRHTAPASADNPSTAGVAELTKERITEVGLRLRIQAFENANYRFVQGSKMTEPEQDEFNQQVEFARAIWRLAAPVAQSTAGAAKDTPESMANSNARFAIDGAIQYGRENRNQPPSTDHWLYEYWNIGRQLNEAGRTGWDNVTPLAAPALNPSEVPHWISVEDRLPAAENEDTGRDAMVSDSLFIRGVAIDGGEAIGLGDYSPDAHVPDAGWRCYGGDYDFMHFAKVTHWMKPGRPAAPEHSALRTASKEGGAA